jgi:hypothetical protein
MVLQRPSGICTLIGSPSAALGMSSRGISGPQMVPNYESFHHFKECVIAGQEIFFAVGLTGFEPATT